MAASSKQPLSIPARTTSKRRRIDAAGRIFFIVPARADAAKQHASRLGVLERQVSKEPIKLEERRNVVSVRFNLGLLNLRYIRIVSTDKLLLQTMISTPASSPFDHPKADIILRSSDGVDFRVFKLFLTLASPFFETMFELPQPAAETNDNEKDGLPVIPVQEDSKTLDTFLRFCYPSTLAEDPSLESLTDIQAILGAARKYSLDLIERKVCQALANPKVLEVEPLRCFAIARNARLKHETITAARYTLQQPLIPAWFAEIELITASDLLALLTYHKKCGIAVEPLLANLDWVMSHYGSSGGCNWLFPQIPGSKSNCQCGRSTEAKFKLWAPAPVLWWATYMNETFELLRDIPSGDVARSEAEKTIQKVRSAGCTTCSSQVKANMEEFSNLLALNVEKATASIELEMDF